MTDNDVQKLKQMYGCSGNYKIKVKTKLNIRSFFARFVPSNLLVIPMNLKISPGHKVTYKNDLTQSNENLQVFV